MKKKSESLKRLFLLVSFILSIYLSFSETLSATSPVKLVKAATSPFNSQVFVLPETGFDKSNLRNTTTTTLLSPYFDNAGMRGADLTICVFNYVLPVRWLAFTAEFINQTGVQLRWDVTEDNTIKQYYVERSTDANHWQRLSAIKRNGPLDLSAIQYYYTDYVYLPGKSFYRIVGEDVYGKSRTSDVRQMIIEDQSFSINPNPAKNKLTIKQKNIRTSQADIYDSYGRLILSSKLIYPNETIDISRLFRGVYFLKLSVDGIETAHGSFIKL
jgi:hypothetical protein